MEQAGPAGGKSITGPRVTPHAWYTLGVLFLVYGSYAIDRSVVNLVLEPVKREFHLSDASLGLLTGLGYGLTYAIAGLPLGYLIDRFSRVRVLGILLGTWSGLTFLGGLSQSFVQLLASRMAVGAAESGAVTGCLSIIGDRFPRTQRASAIGLFLVSSSFGQALTFILGAMVVAQHGWRAGFFVAGAPGLVLVLLLWTTVREPRRGAMDPVGAAVADKADSWGDTLRFALSQPAALKILLGMVIGLSMNIGVSVWLMSLLLRVHDLPMSQAGLIAGLTIAVGGVIGTPGAGMAADRLAKRNVRWLVLLPAITCLLTAGLGVGMAFATDLVALVAFIAAFQLLSRGLQGPGYGLMLSLMKPGMRGRAVGALQVAVNLVGTSLGPMMIGALSDAIGGPDSLRYAMASVMILSVVAGLLFFAAASTLERDLDRAAGGSCADR